MVQLHAAVTKECAMAAAAKDRAERSRRKITDASAKLFRERGFRGVSVAELMNAAELTHGGFYAHFPSKDALLAEAVVEGFQQSALKLASRIPSSPTRGQVVTALLEGFLTPAARDAPGSACPSSSLANDVAREPLEAPVRSAYLQGLERLVKVLCVRDDGHRSQDIRAEALADVATMVGALVLARATRGHVLSDQIIEAARDRLINSTLPTSADQRSGD